MVVTAGAAKARGRGAAAAPAVGRAAKVVNLDGHGWAVIQALDTGERLRLQQRFLAHAQGAGGALGGAGGGGGGVGGPASPTSCAAAPAAVQAAAHQSGARACFTNPTPLVASVRAILCWGGSLSVGRPFRQL